jgi:hypothetical protein
LEQALLSILWNNNNNNKKKKKKKKKKEPFDIEDQFLTFALHVIPRQD